MNTHIMISQSMAADRVAPLAAQQPWRPNFPLSLSDLCPSLWFASSQVPAQLLLALNGLKQSLEIADTKAFVRLTLYTLDEDGRPVLDGPHEYLQQVALFVKVNEDIELLNLVQILLDLHGTRR